MNNENDTVIADEQLLSEEVSENLSSDMLTGEIEKPAPVRATRRGRPAGSKTRPAAVRRKPPTPRPGPKTQEEKELEVERLRALSLVQPDGTLPADTIDADSVYEEAEKIIAAEDSLSPAEAVERTFGAYEADAVARAETEIVDAERRQTIREAEAETRRRRRIRRGKGRR